MSYALTVIATIDPDRRTELVAALARFRAVDLPDTHFTRLVIVDDDDKQELPSLLAWESNHDGATDDYLRACAEEAPSLDAVFSCCLGYPGTIDIDGWLAWMKRHSHHAAAFYAAYREVAKRQVDNDGRIHAAIRTTIDAPGARATLAKMPHDTIRARIARAVTDAHPELDASPQPEPSWLGPRILAVLGALALLLPALLLFPFWYVLLRRAEKSDPPTDPASRPVHDDDRHQDVEDVYAQNQFTHLVDIKPGWFRLATVWLVLTAIDVVARVYCVDGDLGGITSIHFARWVILLDPREDVRIKRHRLLFFSNYDGSWESYLGEFIDRASGWLTAVWSNTVDFPTAKNLYQLGATDEEAFKQWTRDHQIPTQMWWTGVPRSTVQNVRDDVWIRRRLVRPLQPDEAKQWLTRL